MWCNDLPEEKEGVYYVSMPHAAFYVVQQDLAWLEHRDGRFNAARSILCGATRL